MITKRFLAITTLGLVAASSIYRGTAAVGDHWPQWRGPLGNGLAQGGAPLEWGDGRHVKWSIEIPGRGHSTPIIWGDRIFLTTAVPTGARPASPEPPAPAETESSTPGRRGGFRMSNSENLVEHRFEVLCIDRRTGKLLWQRTARTATPHEGYHRTYGSFASNSPVTDGRHVYAFFGSRGLYCYDLDGNLVWEKDFSVRMKMKLEFGEGSAPALEGDRIILNFDHEGDSFIVALDKRDGKEIWRKSRDEASSWSHPFVLEHQARRQVVMTATNKVRSYDFETGSLLWECAGLGANTIPTPVYDGELVYVMSGFRNPNLMAIRLGRDGDLTGSEAVVWSNARGNAYTTSPILFENKLYVLTDNGLVSCYNAKTGEPYYQQTRLPKSYSFKASPVAAGGRLYLASEEGDVIVVGMGERFDVLATNTLKDQAFIASPAVVGGELFLRGQNRLFCISEVGSGR